jgi:glutathione S-transferase
MLSLLGLPVEKIDVDLATGAQKAPEYLARNPFGQVPVIEDGEVTVADSNAILVYLASRYDASGCWLPRDPAASAKVQQWLSVAAGQLASGPALARALTIFRRPGDVAAARALARRLFDVMEAELAKQTWLAGTERPTIADIAVYSYTAHAPEGGVPLDPYPAIRAWLGRIEALTGFVPMARSPIPEPV